MNATEQVKIVNEKLTQNGINDNLEAEWLVALALDAKISKLGSFENLTKQQIGHIEKCLEKRIKGMPISYIFKSSEFYGRNFYVDKNVLIPRPETELLVEKVIEQIKKNDYHSVLDIGCGSGVIGITINAETGAHVVMLDISKGAIKIAKKNVKKHAKNIKILHSDLYNKLKPQNKFDVIVSNPPYITSEDMTKLDKEVKNFEPHEALWGGNDGLYYYKKIIEKAKQFLNNDGLIAFEVGYNQAESVKELLDKNGFCDIMVIKDYNKIDRIVLGKMER